MKNKKIIIIGSSLILITIVAFTLLNNGQSNSSENVSSSIQSSQMTTMEPNQELIDTSQGNNEYSESIKMNEYYIIYINNTDGSTTSFVPTSLNPKFKEGESYNVSISTDDNGNIINNDKIIVVNDYNLSDENKDYIYKILPDEKSSLVAIEEIQKQIYEVKTNLKQ